MRTLGLQFILVNVVQLILEFLGLRRIYLTLEDILDLKLLLVMPSVGVRLSF